MSLVEMRQRSAAYHKKYGIEILDGATMKKTDIVFPLLAALLLLPGLYPKAIAEEPAETKGKLLRANIVGAVRDTQGNPVEGLVISAHGPSGELVASAVTDEEGKYVMECLNQDQYSLSLDPVTTGFQGQTVVASLGPEGLMANWAVSGTAPAVAAAKPGGGPCGSYALWPAIGVLGVGGLVGGLAGGGVFDGGGGGGLPVSPTQ